MSTNNPMTQERLDAIAVGGAGMSATATRAMGSHQSHRMGTDVWLTPPHIVEALGPFDLDPCAATDRPWDTAFHHYTKEDDGLAHDWVGRVWCNPPYGLQAWTWLERLADHGQGTALVFARTETAGFFRTVWRRASACLFLEGRLHFHHPDGTRAPANAGAPSVLVAYGDYDAHRLATCGLPGAYVDLRPGVERLRALTTVDEDMVERAKRAFGAAAAQVSSIPLGMSEDMFIDSVGLQHQHAIRAALDAALNPGEGA